MSQFVVRLVLPLLLPDVADLLVTNNVAAAKKVGVRGLGSREAIPCFDLPHTQTFL
jgi:hypothetical protein